MKNELKNIESYTNKELTAIVRSFGTTEIVRTAAAGELAIRALAK